jgi:hypothetical protein
MAFGKTDPSEVLGMSQDEFQARLSKLDTYEERFAAIQEESKKATEGVTAILQRLEAMQPKEEEGQDDLTDDPLKPLANQTLNNTIMLAHRTARELYPDQFKRWGTEIVKKMADLSPQQQADDRVWKAMVMMVTGEHAADLEKDGAEGKFSFLEPVSAGLRPDPKSSDGRSTAERLMVKKLAHLGPKELTADKYKAGKANLEKARSARLGSFAEVG